MRKISQNEKSRNPETKDMNVDECIRGRLLRETQTKAANHVALCMTTCCTQTAEEKSQR